MLQRVLGLTLSLGILLGVSGPTDAAVISVGAFPDLSPAPVISIPAGTFLVPVQISGAVNLQNWQFDLVFDNSVVEEVDPLDGSAGIYGAEFTPGDPATSSFVLGGFPFNALGLVDDVAGSYPSLVDGPSGDGILAYILFRFLDGQEGNNPGFTIEDVPPPPVPLPSSLALLAAGAVTLSFARRRLRRRP